MKKYLINKNSYWDYTSNKFIFKNNEIDLEKNEQELLKLLFRFPHCTNSYIELVDKIWNDEFLKKKDELISLIINLNKKLPIDIIEEIKGLGYRI